MVNNPHGRDLGGSIVSVDAPETAGVGETSTVRVTVRGENSGNLAGPLRVRLKGVGVLGTIEVPPGRTKTATVSGTVTGSIAEYARLEMGSYLGNWTQVDSQFVNIVAADTTNARESELGADVDFDGDVYSGPTSRSSGSGGSDNSSEPGESSTSSGSSESEDDPSGSSNPVPDGGTSTSTSPSEGTHTLRPPSDPNGSGSTAPASPDYARPTSDGAAGASSSSGMGFGSRLALGAVAVVAVAGVLLS